MSLAVLAAEFMAGLWIAFALATLGSVGPADDSETSFARYAGVLLALAWSALCGWAVTSVVRRVRSDVQSPSPRPDRLLAAIAAAHALGTVVAAVRGFWPAATALLLLGAVFVAGSSPSKDRTVAQRSMNT
ncbi:hypothetical protein ABT263_04770 [Kitasatospora sp. NPDC001603]|uniref:hypothetical protein n=1 Tax=Kitasatospora sp. NPDC001603 TaxID=3154388 RepID=UPI003333D78D